MTSFSGVLLLNLGLKLEESRRTLMMTLALVMYFAFVSVLNYDVRDYKSIHFVSLFVLLVVGTTFIHMVDIPRWCMMAYDLAVVCFVVVMASNFIYLRWSPPYMTIQAGFEILWALAMCFCLWMYISSFSHSS